jgi:exosortase
MADSLVTLPVPAWSIRFDRPAQLRAAALTAAFLGLFWELLDFIPPAFGGLTHAWLYEADWSHGPLIPLFSAYLVYHQWERIRRCPVRYAWTGLAILLGGLGIYFWSLSGHLPFGYAKPLAMMVTLLGVIVLLCGLPMLRYAWVPWIYLFFAIPIPQRLYFALTDPLRRMAAIVASAVLSFWPELHVERIGSNLEYVYNGAAGVTSGVIGVADACSGMRSTVTLCAVGVAVAFMSDRPLWQRIFLVFACIPIATLCNIIRVTITCWLHVFVNPKYASGTYHTLLGLVVILLAFTIFNGLAHLLNRLVIEDPEPEESLA